jgi:hypothetical protein
MTPSWARTKLPIGLSGCRWIVEVSAGVADPEGQHDLRDPSEEGHEPHEEQQNVGPLAQGVDPV